MLAWKLFGAIAAERDNEGDEEGTFSTASARDGNITALWLLCIGGARKSAVNEYVAAAG